MSEQLNDPHVLTIEESITNLAQQAVAEIVKEITEIDGLLYDIDYQLNDLQPPLNGKIRINFTPIDGLIRPVPAIYRRSKADNQWKWDKVGRSRLSLRAKRAREFHDTAELVSELLSHASALMQMRSDLIQSVTNLRLSAKFKLKSVKPKRASILHRVRLIFCEIDFGWHRTFITKHEPPRKV